MCSWGPQCLFGAALEADRRAVLERLGAAAHQPFAGGEPLADLDPAVGAEAQLQRAGAGDPFELAVLARLLHRHEGNEAALAGPHRFLGDDAGMGIAPQRETNLGGEARPQLGVDEPQAPARW